jgi:hypothetical protein
MRPIQKKRIVRRMNRYLTKLVKAAPAIALMRRKRSALRDYAAYLAASMVATGVAALMALSPRTRTRALGAAKEGYGKVNEKVGGRLRELREKRRSSGDAEPIEQPAGV